MRFDYQKGYPTHEVRPLKNIRELVHTSAQRYGDKELYVYLENKEKRFFTYNDNSRVYDALGSWLFKHGFRGANMAVIGEQHPDWMSAYLVSIASEGAVVPLDKDLSCSAAAEFIAQTECKVVFATEKIFTAFKQSCADTLSCVECFVIIGQEPDRAKCLTDNRTFVFDDIVEEGQRLVDDGMTDFIDCERDPESLAAVLYTSGTTGSSKGVMLNERMICQSIIVCNGMIAAERENTFVSVLPLHHTFGMTCNHITAIHVGASVFMNDSVKHVMRNFADYKPTSLILVPLYVETMDKKIWDTIRKKGKEKQVRALIKFSNALRRVGIDKRRTFFKDILNAFGGNLEYIVCGGAPLNPEYIKDFDDFGVYIAEGYGITECTPLISVNPFNTRKIGSVGMVAKGMEARIEDPDSEGNGEICVSGPTVFMGYYKNPEATKEAFTEDGWFKTGDIGHIDDENFIYITGRKKNVIIASNGKNVYPEELEEYLHDIPEILESVVIGRQKDGQTVICAVIYPDLEQFKDKTDEEIISFLRGKIVLVNKTLPTYKHIHDIELRRTEFEKTTTRKIKRFLIK